METVVLRLLAARKLKEAGRMMYETMPTCNAVSHQYSTLVMIAFSYAPRTTVRIEHCIRS